MFRIGGSIETNNSQFYLVAFIKKIKVGLYAECLDFDCMNYLVKYYIVYGLAFHIHKIKIPTYSAVSIKNIDILPNRQYIANTADSPQEQYS